MPAARGTAAMQRQAQRHGAELRGTARVEALVPRADGVDVVTADGTVSAARVVVTADAWTTRLLAPLGRRPAAHRDRGAGHLLHPDRPLTVLPQGLPGVDLDGRPVLLRVPDLRRGDRQGRPGLRRSQGRPATSAPAVTDEQMLGRLAGFMAGMLPGAGSPVRSKRCLYTLTPDRDFVVSSGPGAREHRRRPGCRPTPSSSRATFGRLLTDLVVDGKTDADISAFGLERPALTDPGYEVHWMV